MPSNTKLSQCVTLGLGVEQAVYTASFGWGEQEEEKARGWIDRHNGAYPFLGYPSRTPPLIPLLSLSVTQLPTVGYYGVGKPDRSSRAHRMAG